MGSCKACQHWSRASGDHGTCALIKGEWHPVYGNLNPPLTHAWDTCPSFTPKDAD